MREKLVVVGNGMAGIACVEAILRHKPDFDITVLSEEPYYNYNRILLSSVLAGDKTVEDIYLNTREWYEENKISLHKGNPVVKIERHKRLVIAADAGGTGKPGSCPRCGFPCPG